MAEPVRHVVIGAGPAGTRAAEMIRRRDRQARIVIVSADPYPLYNRILLSKEFLKDDGVAPEDLFLRPLPAYEAQRIELRTGTRALRLNPAARTIELSRGEPLTYDRCLIASGTRPMTLPMPGFELPGVHLLRTLDDAVALRAEAQRARRAVVIGGGLIGVEVGAALAERGIAVQLVAREAWLFGHVAPEPVGRGLESILGEGGVEILLGTTVTGLEPGTGPEGGLRVRTGYGGTLPADLVVVGIGVVPAVEFLAGSGLIGPRGGVLVDDRLRTEAPGVYAAGDLAAWPDPMASGARHRIEHWTHAQHQGRCAAANMTGGDEPYARVSTYDTELFGTGLTVAGCPELAESWVEDGSLREREGVAWGMRGGQPIAAYDLGGFAGGSAMAERIAVGALLPGGG